MMYGYARFIEEQLVVEMPCFWFLAPISQGVHD